MQQANLENHIRPPIDLITSLRLQNDQLLAIYNRGHFAYDEKNNGLIQNNDWRSSIHASN